MPGVGKEIGGQAGGAGVGSGPGGAPPEIGVEHEVTSTSRPPLPHGHFQEEAEANWPVAGVGSLPTWAGWAGGSA